MALDDLKIKIQVMLDQLKADMGKAEKIVGDSVKKMTGTTSGGAGGNGGLLGLFGRGLATRQLLMSGLTGITAGVSAFQGDVQGARQGLLEMSNTLTFGVAGALQKLIEKSTGVEQAFKNLQQRIQFGIEAQNQLANLITRGRHAEQDLAVAQAFTPAQRLSALQARLRSRLTEDQLRLLDTGASTRSISRALNAELALGQLQNARSVFGNITQQNAIELLRQQGLLIPEFQATPNNPTYPHVRIPTGPFSGPSRWMAQQRNKALQKIAHNTNRVQ